MNTRLQGRLKPLNYHDHFPRVEFIRTTLPLARRTGKLPSRKFPSVYAGKVEVTGNGRDCNGCICGVSMDQGWGFNLQLL